MKGERNIMGILISYYLMIAGMVMMIMGLLSWTFKSRAMGKQMEFVGFGIMTLIFIILLILTKTNVNDSFISRFLVFRIIYFLLGLVMMFTIDHSIIMDKIQKIIDKLTER